MSQQTRRGVIQGASALALFALAGCSERPVQSASSSPTPDYERLRRTATYVSDDVGLRLPEEVPHVEAPTNADLIVVHGNPSTGAEQVVSWLAADRRVALLGDRAQETWLAWTRSETYRDTFGDQARGEGDPDPHLLVAAATDTAVTTDRYSWTDLPSNRDLLQSLEDALSS